MTPAGLEPIFEAELNYYIKYSGMVKKMRLNFNKNNVYSRRDSNPQPIR